MREKKGKNLTWGWCEGRGVNLVCLVILLAFFLLYTLIFSTTRCWWWWWQWDGVRIFQERSVIFKRRWRRQKIYIDMLSHTSNYITIIPLKHHECFMYCHVFFASPSMGWYHLEKYTCVQVLFIISQLNSWVKKNGRAI